MLVLLYLRLAPLWTDCKLFIYDVKPVNHFYLDNDPDEQVAGHGSVAVVLLQFVLAGELVKAEEGPGRIHAVHVVTVALVEQLVLVVEVVDGLVGPGSVVSRVERNVQKRVYLVAGTVAVDCKH